MWVPVNELYLTIHQAISCCYILRLFIVVFFFLTVCSLVVIVAPSSLSSFTVAIKTVLNRRQATIQINWHELNGETGKINFVPIRFCSGLRLFSHISIIIEKSQQKPSSSTKHIQSSLSPPPSHYHYNHHNHQHRIVVVCKTFEIITIIRLLRYYSARSSTHNIQLC